MHLTTKGRLAVSAMMDLALRGHQGPVTLVSISRRQTISLSYLEQLFGRLRRHRLVQSSRGPGGGYRLARPMESISVADIILAVDGSLEPAESADEQNDGGGAYRLTSSLWSSLNRQVMDFLDSVTLRDLIEGHRNRVAEAPSAMAEALAATN
jgi:Rrf2 family transcriptional regulator, iron-sulfur cluster assembly transcription factor